MAKLSFIEQFVAARRASTPLIWIQTPDPQATISTINREPEHRDIPMLLWDTARGLIAANEPHGKNLVVQLLRNNKDLAASLCNPIEMLVKARELPKDTVLFMLNLHHWVRDPVALQAIWNIRDVFKKDTRSMVALSPAVTLPAEIAGDVVILNEPLPDETQLAQIVADTYEGVDQPVPKADFMNKATDALCGLPAFAAEQVCAMSIHKAGIDLDQLWERKRQQIEQTPGLSVWRGPETFADLGGCENAKQFLTRIRNGKDSPRAIIFQDEIEKQFAGAGGDLSGTSQELHGMQLTYMQDHDATGLMLIGHPGVAKTAISKAFGNEAGIPLLQLNVGNAKGGIVGDTNRNMNMILKVIEAVSQNRAIWIATCNDLSALSPELRSRYTFGTFFFDLPTPAERALIWEIYFKKFGLSETKTNPRPLDTGWTGREIKNCCLLSYRLEIPLREAANYIVPISTSQKDRIINLRREADGCYISASTPGPYKAPEGMEQPGEDPTILVAALVPGKRKISTGGNEPGGKKGSVN